jgi:N-acetylglucosamine malate deacetylase 1
MDNTMLPKNVLAIGAHPDDIEFTSAGLLALLKQCGWNIFMATMTYGDAGSATLPREEISKIRIAEQRKSASVLDAQYECMGCEDVFVLYERKNILRLAELVRKVQPKVIIAPNPACYMVDHTNTSVLAKTAALIAGIPNIVTPGVQPFSPVPYLYYCDPMGFKNDFGDNVNPSIIIDISTVFNIKKQMLQCHESQRSWLDYEHKVDNYIDMMEEMAKKRGKAAGATYGEGFYQHLGFSYPQDNILSAELGEHVHIMKRDALSK